MITTPYYQAGFVHGLMAGSRYPRSAPDFGDWSAGRVSGTRAVCRALLSMSPVEDLPLVKHELRAGIRTGLLWAKGQEVAP